MDRIAADIRKRYSGGVPSMDALRAFRSRHRDITFRAQEPKETVKLNAEQREHVNPFFDIIKGIEQTFPGLLQKPHRI